MTWWQWLILLWLAPNVAFVAVGLRYNVLKQRERDAEAREKIQGIADSILPN